MTGFILRGDNEFEEIVVFFNPNEYPVTLFAFGKYGVYVGDGKAGTEPMRYVEGEYTVDALDTIVLARKYPEPEPEVYEGLATD